MIGSRGNGPASKGNGARLQGSLDCEELVAYLLAVQVLDDVVCQANLLEFAEGVALQRGTTLQAATDHITGHGSWKTPSPCRLDATRTESGSQTLRLTSTRAVAPRIHA